LAAKVVNYKVNKGISWHSGSAGEQNIQGEDQQNGCLLWGFIQTLINREIVCGIASEENDDFITVQAIKPQQLCGFDGSVDSSNIDVNVSVELFSLFTGE
jgi:fructose-1,6-bisphosphatase I